MACLYCNGRVILFSLGYAVSHSQIFFWLLLGQTPSSIPSKMIAVPVYMTKLLVVLVLVNVSSWEFLADLVFPAQQSKVLRVKKNSEYIQRLMTYV